MESLAKMLIKKSTNELGYKPEIFNPSLKKDRRKLELLLRKNICTQVVDYYKQQLEELFAINNPPLTRSPNFKNKFQAYLTTLNKKMPLAQQGKWVYFPWLRALVHILEEKDFFKVRTARNKLLITEEEQEQFYNAKIGIGGLSIGSSVAMALVLQGGAKHIRLADFDILALSNTNRIRAGVQNLGLPKVEITARQIYETNPYAQVKIFPQGLNEKNIKKFTKGLNVLVDEMDNLAIKLLLRKEAKKQKIPVVMGADNGDSAIVDIERYDKKSKVAFFHRRLGNLTYNQLRNLTKFETGKKIAQLIGLENHTERMLNSLQEIGKSVISWPQLGGTAIMNGVAVAYCVRRIICNQPLRDNRGILSLNETFQDNYFSKKSRTKF